MITRQVLLGFNFREKIINGEPVYINGVFAVKEALGRWLIMGNHNGQLLAHRQVIETIEELKQSFYETTRQVL